MTKDALLDVLALELEKPRVLPAQVGRHLASTYGIGRDEIGTFITEELPGLEDYEIDLTLSPVFTPSLQDQSVVAEVLGGETVNPESIEGLIHQLVARPTVARLTSEDGQVHAVPLREVTVARYVNRLRLAGSIPAPILEAIVQAPSEARPLLKAVARRGIWETPGRRAILEHFLQMATKGSLTNFLQTDATALLRLIETYEPADRAELVSRMPGWLDASHRELNEAGQAKPFFNERVEDLHGGGRDQRRANEAGVACKRAELESLERLFSALRAQV